YLWKLSKEQHAVVGQRRLAGACAQSAAHQGWHGRRMMRAAERPPVGERATLDLAGHRSDHRDFQQFRPYPANAQPLLTAVRARSATVPICSQKNESSEAEAVSPIV